MTRTIRILGALSRFMIGGGFPVFALSLLLCSEVLLIGILFVPSDAAGLGAFADDFRIWCYGYDPATGRVDWAYVMAMLTPQCMLGAFITLFWWEPLRDALGQPRRVAALAGAAVLLMAASLTGFSFADPSSAKGELPFPAEALRTSHPAPTLALVDQENEPVSLSALRGKVVLLTAVYASCGSTCPALLMQTKNALETLEPEQREGLRVVAVTLDPENDSAEALAELAERHGMHTPVYHLVTGDVQDVERTLDQMEIARRRDPDTGMIDHANLVLLIDRRGRVAYRLGLGERQQRWLASALRVLLDERAS